MIKQEYLQIKMSDLFLDKDHQMEQNIKPIINNTLPARCLYCHQFLYCELLTEGDSIRGPFL